MKTRTRVELEGILKALFFCSIAPYILIFAFAIYSAFAGCSNVFLSHELYGGAAFLYILYIFFGFWTFIIPIFPPLFIYQIFYLTLLFYRHRKTKRKQTMDPAELQKITQLTGVAPADIKLADDGFWSRGYIIDDGRIVFKFKKSPEVDYRPEIRMLGFVNSLGLKINLQRVGWTSPDDEYLGLYGVIGKSLESTSYDAADVGRQLGIFLKQLHNSSLKNAERLTLAAEISAWQERFHDAKSYLLEFFSNSEYEILDHFMSHAMPEKLKALGEKPVLSHGDLGDGNIFVDPAGKVGVIDFNETCYLDEAADFMDVDSSELCAEMLKSYGADDVLRDKVALRRQLRPLIVFVNYAKRGDQERVENLARQIKHTLL